MDGANVAASRQSLRHRQRPHSRDGVPTPEQSKAYIAMLAATAGLNPDLSAATIFDFSLAAAAAKEIAAKK